MGLIPTPPGRITAGSARLRGHEILGRSTVGGKQIRGAERGMIFQDPMTSLNPTMTIGDQIAEPLQVHRGYSARDAITEAIRLIELCKIPEAAKRARQYPFEFSGGMWQRAMIAMAMGKNNFDPRRTRTSVPTRVPVLSGGFLLPCLLVNRPIEITLGNLRLIRAEKVRVVKSGLTNTI